MARKCSNLCLIGLDHDRVGCNRKQCSVITGTALITVRIQQCRGRVHGWIKTAWVKTYLKLKMGQLRNSVLLKKGSVNPTHEQVTRLVV